MASGFKEDMGESSCAESDGSLSQPTQSGPLEAAEDSRCPICLGHMKRPAYVTYCMHKFCFRCIREWAGGKDNCPVCRQPMEKLLYSVQGQYKECEVGLSARLQRMVMHGGFQPLPAATLQQAQAAHNRQPSAGRRRTPRSDSAQRQEDAPGPSNTPSQQAPAFSTSDETAPLRAGERPAGPAAPPDPHNGTE